MSQKSNNFVFTNYNPKWDIEKFDKSNISYICAQQEKCPTTGKLHIQGYLETTEKFACKVAKKLIFTDQEHFEIRRGTQEQAIKYCKKEETRVNGPWEWGTPRKQGQRNDLQGIKKMIDEGKDEEEIFNTHLGSYIRYFKGFDRYRISKVKPRKEPPQAFILWGDAGSGKSRYPYDKHKSVYNKPQGKWWDGYEGQEAILIDDVSWTNIDRNEMLTLADRYPIKREVKGGFVCINSPYIYFTSNEDPNLIMDEAIKRRFTIIEINRGCGLAFGSTHAPEGACPAREAAPRLAPTY